MRIQHNIAALNSYRQLSGNNSALGKNLEKLSSGYRINRAGDDAAGLAISEKMRADIKILEAAQKNANDGISLVQTAEGALTEVHSMLNRMSYLATQSANGTYGQTNRDSLQSEVNALVAEIDRIATSTEFNGIALFSGNLGGTGGAGGTTNTPQTTPGAAPTQTGTIADDTISAFTNGSTGTNATFTIDVSGAELTKPADGSTGYKGKLTVAGQDIEFDFDASKDKLTAADIATALNGKSFTIKAIDNTDLTFTATKGGSGTDITFTANTDKAVNTTDAAKLAVGQKYTIAGVAGTIAPAADTPATAAAGDAAGGAGGAGDATAPVAPVVTGGTNGKVNTTPTAGSATDAAKFEIDFTGFSIAKPTDGTKGTAKVTIGGTDIDLGEVGEGMDAAKIATALKDKTFSMKADDGTTDLTFTATVTGNKVTFTADKAAVVAVGNLPADATVTGVAATADNNGGGNGGAAGGTGVLDLQVGENSVISVSIQAMSAASLGVDKIDISTQAEARKAIKAVKGIIDTVSSQRGALGAIQNRLEHTINNLGVTTENLTAAESRIRDTDMAEEMMAYTKNNILVQAAQAMLAQANTVPQGVLQLLQ